MKLKNWIMGGAIAVSALLSSNAEAQNRLNNQDKVMSFYDSLRTATVEQYESLSDSMQIVLEDVYQKRFDLLDKFEARVLNARPEDLDSLIYESNERRYRINEGLDSSPSDLYQTHDMYFKDLDYILNGNSEADNYRFNSNMPNFEYKPLFNTSDSTRTDTKELSRSILFGDD